MTFNKRLDAERHPKRPRAGSSERVGLEGL
jgi:hypothetical protein